MRENSTNPELTIFIDNEEINMDEIIIGYCYFGYWLHSFTSN